MPHTKKKRINLQEELIIKGIAVSGGYALGPVGIIRSAIPEVNEFKLTSPGDILQESERFKRALEATREQLNHQIDEAKKKYGKEYGQILESHFLILEDEEMIRGTLKIIQNQHINAEAAFSTTMDKFKNSFLKSSNEYLRERAVDIEDVKRRVLNNLLGQQRVIHVDEPSVIVADAIKPSDILNIDRARILGFISESGSQVSHFAIIARSLNIPAVVGIVNVTGFLADSDLVIVDGQSGEVILNPYPATVEKYRRKIEQHKKETRALASMAPLPCITQDGRAIKLMANVELLDEVPTALQLGAEGIGLYRTEYLLFTKREIPTEREQYDQYAVIAQRLAPLPVVMRTFDVGGDKVPLEILTDHGYVHEDNPFLGWRAIRIGLECPEFFKPQIRALLRLAAKYPVEIMLPMITGIEEVRAAKKIIQQCQHELQKEGLAYQENPRIGIMIETPAAALMADVLATESDFFSIGTNDLVQYTLAADRGNPKVSNIYSCFHPSVLRLIRMTIETGERHHIPVSMCGEMASNPNATILLLGLGLKEFSVLAPMLPKIKKIIRHTTFEYARNVAASIMELQEVHAIERMAALEARKILGR